MKPNGIFELDPQLQRDCIPLGRFALSRVLLMNESRYPWLILVPERPAMTELFQLDESDQQEFIRESCATARHLKQVFAPDKINVAAIGNLVPQLHVHHVVRYRNDAAWPAPVWGRFTPVPYSPEALRACLDKMRLVDIPGFIPTRLP